MYKFYYYCNLHYSIKNLNDNNDYLLKALFIERGGFFRIGSFLNMKYSDGSVERLIWRWRPDFNGKFTPLIGARNKPKLSSDIDITIAGFTSSGRTFRCKEDRWFESAKEIQRSQLAELDIIFDEREFDSA